MTTVELFPTPLPHPPAPYEEWREYWPDYLSTYDTIRGAERHADEQVGADPSNLGARDDVMFARLAGYLLLEFFNRRATLTEGPCASLVKQIGSSPREFGDSAHDIVFKVGRWHFDHLLRPYWASSKGYLIPSLHPSRTPFDTLEDMAVEYMKADSKDYWATRGKALVRDGFRCMLTGMFDDTSLKRNRELGRLCDGLTGIPSSIQMCRILNGSAMQDIDPTMDSEKSTVINKTQSTTGILAILRHLGLESLAQELLSAGGVYDLGNTLSLDINTHSQFNILSLWFEGTDKPNNYTVCVPTKGDEMHLRLSDHLRVDGDRLSVTFYSNYQNARLPSPQLLALHAACARAAHMSGAVKTLYELEWDIEETRVLAYEGYSARLLHHLLSPLAAIPGAG